jgi:hypothetical protein
MREGFRCATSNFQHSAYLTSSPASKTRIDDARLLNRLLATSMRKRPQRRPPGLRQARARRATVRLTKDAPLVRIAYYGRLEASTRDRLRSRGDTVRIVARRAGFAAGDAVATAISATEADNRVCPACLRLGLSRAVSSKGRAGRIMCIMVLPPCRTVRSHK